MANSIWTLEQFTCPSCGMNYNATREELQGKRSGSFACIVCDAEVMANSREDEMEADRIGFRTAVQAGYAPSKVGEFYIKLQKMEAERKQGGAPLLASLADVLSTHPPSNERVQQMSEMASAVPASPRAITSTQTFDRIRKRAGELARAKASKG